MNNIARLQAELKRNDGQGILITDNISREFATGLATSAGIALITPAASFFMVDFRYFEAARRALSGTEVIMVERASGYFPIINELCQRLNIKSLLYEDERMSVATRESFGEKIEAELAPSGRLLAHLRVCKQSFEIENIKKAQKIAEKTLDQVCPLLRPGVSDLDIKAEIEYRLVRQGCQTAFDTIVAVGKNSSMPHARAEGRLIAEGDFVTIDMGAKYNGYCSDMTRTFAVSRADDEMKKVYDIVLRAQAAALGAARAGVSYTDVDTAARALIEAEGYGDCFGHGLGHGVGLEVHEDLFALSAQGGLKENSIMTFEPGIYLEGKFGVRIEDFGAITPDGVENFTSFAKELLILGA